MAPVLPVEERFLGEVVRAPETGLGIETGQLPIRDRGQEGDDQREADPRPHVGGDRAAVGGRRGGLELERDPEERSRRDQRHRVHGDAGESERRSRLRLFGHGLLPSSKQPTSNPYASSGRREISASSLSVAPSAGSAQKTGSSADQGRAGRGTRVAARTVYAAKGRPPPAARRMRQRPARVVGRIFPRRTRITSSVSPDSA